MDTSESFVKTLQNSKLFTVLNQNATYLKYLVEKDKVKSNENEFNSFLTRPEIKNLFKNDLRLTSVFELLQYYSPVDILKPKEFNETTLLHQQKLFALKMLLRTFALPLGMSCFKYSSENSFFPERAVLPSICVSVKLPPTYTNCIDPDMDEVEPESFLFPSFNSAVGYALAFPASSSQIQSSWILYNKPAELTSDFGALLYGFSLIGNDAFMNFNFVQDILQSGNPLLAAAVLLAIGVKYKQSCDLEAGLLLSSYIPSFCNGGQNETEGTLIVQMAAVVAAGLVYMGSGKKAIVNFLLQEVTREGVVFLNPKSKTYKNILDKELYNDCYRNCAAIAIGLICLGEGPTADAKLKALKNSGLFAELESNAENSIWSTSATISMMIIWMDSNDAMLLSKVEKIYKSLLLKGNVHHVFLYGIFMRLISTDKITIPQTEFLSLTRESISKSLNTVYDICASCYCLCLTSASTGNKDILSFLLQFLEFLCSCEDPVEDENSSFQVRIVQNSIAFCINCIYMCIGMLCAGTCDIEVLKLLRREHFQLHSYTRNYAIHYALGLLFLGCGKFALDTSTRSNKAFILISTLPFFPQSFNENTFYFQPLRFLWALATVPKSNLCKSHAELPFSLANRNCFSFLNRIIPETDDLEVNFLKSELFNMFECGMSPSPQLIALLDRYFATPYK